MTARAITSQKLSKQYLEFAPDAIWAAQALPDSTTLSSSEFLIGQDQAGVAIRLEADTTVDIAAGQALTVQLKTGTSTGSYDTTTTIYTADAGGVTFEIDDLIVEYCPSDQDQGIYAVLDVITDADESADKVNAYLRNVSH
jgi:hypothetical protein